MNKSGLGVFDPSRGVTLRRLPNDGWIVIQQGQEYALPEELGAYTTAEEMLRALHEALTPINFEVQT